jgi:hypothetical protein
MHDDDASLTCISLKTCGKKIQKKKKMKTHTLRGVQAEH